MTTHSSPERALLVSFANNPDMWRPVVNSFLNIGLSDLVDFCAEWYGTEPSPIHANKEA